MAELQIGYKTLFSRIISLSTYFEPASVYFPSFLLKVPTPAFALPPLTLLSLNK